MTDTMYTKIDVDRCVACGRCTAVCPSDLLSLTPDQDHATVSFGNCMQCGQCVAVCAADAIAVAGISNKLPVFDKAGPLTPAIVNLITARRSCRSYEDTPVPRATIEALIEAGVWAPSSTNSQVWTFTVVEDRQKMEQFAILVGNFYRRLNRIAARPVARAVSKIFMNDVLGRYYRDYHDTVQTALTQWDDHRKDILFHGATAAIVVATKPGGSGPTEDALLATQNILLTAQSLGIGTCLIGFAVEAMKRDRSIGQKLGIADAETVRAVIALGHPATRYLHPSGRKPPEIRYTP